jgi:hypothetical protein
MILPAGTYSVGGTPIWLVTWVPLRDGSTARSIDPIRRDCVYVRRIGYRRDDSSLCYFDWD